MLLVACSDNGGVTGDFSYDADQDGFLVGMDCDDQDAAVGPRYLDADGDGHGSGAWNAGCGNLEAPGYAANGGDCDDTDRFINPAASEACDARDNNCNGLVDELVELVTVHPDVDGDGFGDAASFVNACQVSEGYVTNDDDCDDLDPDIHPDALELCDEADNDCNGVADDDLELSRYYPDRDGDGHGGENSSVEGCAGPPDGYATVPDDCNDDDPLSYPGAEERCDGADNDCDRIPDDGIAFRPYHADVDQDGFGDPASYTTACAPLEGTVVDGEDCDDNDEAVHPGALEALCNALDENCSGSDDDHPDRDGDGFDACAMGLPGADAEEADCDDSDPLTFPGAIEAIGNLKDSNCNGIEDWIFLVAGNGAVSGSAENSPATSVPLGAPTMVAVGPKGELYIADEGSARVRRVNVDGTLVTVAGTGSKGFSGDGGAATAAMLDLPTSVAVDSAGNLFIADRGNHRVRMVKGDTGVIVTVAGNGLNGYNGDGVQATTARLNVPNAVAVDEGGNLYIADTNNHRVRKVAVSGLISTVAGSGTNGYAGDGKPATEAKLSSPSGVAVDADGQLYIADTGNFCVRRVDVEGMIDTIAGVGLEPGVSGDGGEARQAHLNAPQSVVIDPMGNLFIADSLNSRIRKVDPQGIISTVAGGEGEGYSGDNGPATDARLFWPEGIAVGADGTLFIADTGNRRIREVLP